MTIRFEKASDQHIDIIFGWLAEPHIQEFWDNSQSHKDDIINFVQGRQTPSSYCDGQYMYWIASFYNEPFAMLMTIQETQDHDIGPIKRAHLSDTGHTYGIEYMIGHKDYFGKGYGAKTLDAFIRYFRKTYDPKADTFWIDPASDNPRAEHVYIQAGFKHVADFTMSADYSGSGKTHHFLIKKIDTRAQCP